MDIGALGEVLDNWIKRDLVKTSELTDRELMSVAEQLERHGIEFDVCQYTSDGCVVFESLNLVKGGTISAEPFYDELSYNGPITTDDAVMVVCGHMEGES